MDDDFNAAAAAAYVMINDDDNGNNNDNDMMSKRKIAAKLTNSLFDVFQYSGVFLRLIMDIWQKKKNQTFTLETNEPRPSFKILKCCYSWLCHGWYLQLIVKLTTLM